MTTANTTFDQFAENYDEALHQGISISGEDKDFFAKGRIVWLSRLLRGRGINCHSVMDFGCGTGSATPYFFDILNAQSVLGIDVSSKSLVQAEQKYGSGRASFKLFEDNLPNGQMDLAFCNGVFHHVPLPRTSRIS